MRSVWLAGNEEQLAPSALIGEGGEAEVYRLRADTAVKVFKLASHPSYAGVGAQAKDLQLCATKRLDMMQKKLPSFPQGLPPQVIAPLQVVHDGVVRTNKIVGYTMKLVDQAQLLRCYGQRDFRESQSIDNEAVAQVFRSIHQTLVALHSRGIVVGDFNNMNVLVANQQALFIDTDSMQFSSFPCMAYSPRYLDPLHAQLDGRRLKINRAHSIASDWYAYSVLLFESLLYVHPYGGIHRPGQGVTQLNADERTMQRISVYNPQVQYPAAAVPLSSLPAPLRDYFQSVFESDLRGEFPLQLLDELCNTPLVSALPRTHLKSTGGGGQAFISPVFATTGTILKVTLVQGKLCFLQYKEGRFTREDGTCVMSGKLSAHMFFHLCTDKTIVARGNQAAVLSGKTPERVSVDNYRLVQPVIESNGNEVYLVDGGWLTRLEPQSGKLTLVDEVLSGQTRIWLGNEFGFGFYQAGDFRRAFLFDVITGTRTNLPADTVALLPLEIRCAISPTALWLFTSHNEQGTIINRCLVISRSGKVLASKMEPESDSSWLGRITGKCAAQSTSGSETLLSAGVDKIVQLQCTAAGDIVVSQEIMANGVLPTDQLLLSNNGLYVWNSHEIRLLSTRSPNSTAPSKPVCLAGT